MKKNVFIGVFIAFAALLLCACGNSKRFTKSTSTRVELASSVRYLPSIATLSVQPNRVSATLDASQMEHLNQEQIKQALVAKALGTVNGDVLIAPQFTTDKNAEGKMSSMTVRGYAASISSFRTMTEADVTFMDTAKQESNRQLDKMALNTMTVAEVEYSSKKSFALLPADLVGKNEEAALKLAKEKLLRQEKMDVLYGVQYTSTVIDGSITSFSITAFPGKYTKYRTTSSRELKSIKPSKEPVVYYQTIAADIKTTGDRIQKTFTIGTATAKEAELKEAARAGILKKYNADFLLNETFYFDYQGQVITNVTICGTPAVYANFRPLEEGDVVDITFAPLDNEKGQSKGFFELLFGKSKK